MLLDAFITFAIILGGVTFFLLVVVYIFFSIRFLYWKRRGIPHPKPEFIFGNYREAVLFQKHTAEVNASIYNQYNDKKFVGYYLLWRPGVMFIDPDLIKAVLVKDFVHFHDRMVHYDEKNDPLSTHIFAIGGQRWRNLRNKLSAAFTSGKLKAIFPTMVTCGGILEDFLREQAGKGGILEVQDIVARFSTDIIATCAYGVEINSIKNPYNDFRVLGKKTFEITYQNAIQQASNFLFPDVAKTFKIPFFHREVTKYFMQIANDIVGYREKNQIHRNDFMDLLIQLKNKGFIDSTEEPEEIIDQDKTPITMTELAAQMYAFFLAGFETSSTTVSFCLLELALNPDIQKKLRTEINSVIARHGKVTYDACMEMTYLDCTLNESLRKYPPVPVLTRGVTKTYRVPNSDVILEEGTHVSIPVLSLQRDPKYYPDPLRFNPDRFKEEEKSKRPGFTFLPFGDGPRICIARRLGLLQSKVALIYLLSKFQFSVCDKTETDVKVNARSFVFAPQSGVWLKVSEVKT